MTTKSVFALAAILALGGLSLPTDASAAHGGGGGHSAGGGGGGHSAGGGHVGGGHIAAGHFVAGHGPGARVAVGHGPGVRVAPGHRARAFVAGGHRRHFWHGRWWYYGVGPCWVWSDFYGEYVWACD